MKLGTKKSFIILFIIIFISSSITIPFIYVFLLIDPKKATIVFIPAYLKSFPNHTAWLIADITIFDSKLLENHSITINTNAIIDMEYNVWNNEPKRKVLEIFLNPNSTHLNQFIQVEVNIQNDYTIIKAFSTLEIIDWLPKNISEVLHMRDEFISYLSFNVSSFGINESIIWESFDNAPQILVVEHYLFRSEFWEMELSRHIMIAPHDWVRIYLRQRNETRPNWAGEISSWSNLNHSIVEIEPPSVIFR